ncbi:LrgB family protein [Vibrio sp. SS-MA-C1-2]|uniref:LrgB family protein n=1 Tax=Vibrio sp. SS-MA-C1-2 TaxID=2908646 RepID=UPI001F2923EC|nr:LrgB family protein [Vibrio sp. SS-MA-C1-2]UJF20152.1 LrgB family protein [Vibrio sp. SS-MA-C1-2]
MMTIFITVFSFFVTIFCYYLSKWLYKKKNIVLFTPLLFAPLLLLLIIYGLNISYSHYIYDSKWLLWMLGPATIAFAVPVYENRHIVVKHWLSLSVGVFTAVVVGVGSSVLLAKLFQLPELLQRSLSVRSITTPFAIEASKLVGGKPDLTALFVVITGVIGILIGDLILSFFSIKTSIAKGAGLAGSSHGAGTAQAYKIDSEAGVVASLVMLFAGVGTISLAPLIAIIFW